MSAPNEREDLHALRPILNLYNLSSLPKALVRNLGRVPHPCAFFAQGWDSTVVSSSPLRGLGPHPCAGSRILSSPNSCPIPHNSLISIQIAILKLEVQKERRGQRLRLLFSRNCLVLTILLVTTLDPKI